MHIGYRRAFDEYVVRILPNGRGGGEGNGNYHMDKKTKLQMSGGSTESRRWLRGRRHAAGYKLEITFGMCGGIFHYYPLGRLVLIILY